MRLKKEISYTPKGRRAVERTFHGEADISDLEDVLREGLRELLSDIAFIAGSRKLDEKWIKRIRYEFKKALNAITRYEGSEKEHDPRVRHTMPLICHHYEELTAEYTKHHNPAEKLEDIAKEVGYATGDHVRKLLIDYRNYRNGNFKGISNKRMNAIELGEQDEMEQKVFQDMFNPPER